MGTWRLFGVVLMLGCAAGTANDGVDLVRHLPVFVRSELTAPAELAHHITTCSQPLCVRLLRMADAPAVERMRRSAWRAQGSDAGASEPESSELLADLLNRALVTPDPTGPAKGQDRVAMLRQNHTALVAHLGAYLGEQPSFVSVPREVTMPFGKVRSFTSQGASLWQDVTTGRLVRMRMPYRSSARSTFTPQQAVECARTWLAQVGVSINGWQLTACEARDRPEARGWALKWRKIKAGVEMPSRLEVGLTSTGILSSMLHLDLPVQVGLVPVVDRPTAIAMLAQVIGVPIREVDAQLTIWFDPAGVQRLQWRLIAPLERGQAVMMVDAHSGEILSGTSSMGAVAAMAPSNMSPPSPQVREARRRMVARTRTQHAALAVLAVLWIGFIGVRWRRPRSPSGQ